MCIGLPMRVIEGDEVAALCERAGSHNRVSMMLVGAQAPGSHVLVHLGSAIRTLSSHEAGLIDDALLALSIAVDGGNVDALFADLVGREPELPPHLR